VENQKITYLAYSPDSQAIASCDQNGWVRLWEAKSGKQLHRLKASEKYIQQVRFSPDGKVIASCGDDGLIRVFDRMSGKQILEINVQQRINCLVFSPDSKTLYSAGGDIRKWDVKSGTEIRFGR
jgi:WD40 repeat protein